MALLFAVAVAFFFGAAAVLAAQAVALLYFLRHLRRDPLSPRREDIPRDLDPEQSIAFAWNKEGVIWILEPDKIPKPGGPPAKPSKDKKDILEVHPEKKYAKIKERSLTLTSSDGSFTKVELVGCTVHAVSASSVSSRKWAKRYPIKIENESSNVYNGSKILYIYLETSWDKESWCRSLRLASSKDNQNVNWHRKVTDEFHSYLSLLLSAYPFLKSHIGPKEATDKVDIKMMDNSSKVRVFLKKLAKKASKNTSDNRTGSILGRDESKAAGESTGSHKSATSEKCANKNPDKDIMPALLDAFAVRNQSTAGADADFDRFGHDEGILSLNLLVARFFFDARKNNTINSYFQERIQRALSNMRTPSYVGAITCINFNLGNLPPYIHGIRVLPMDLNEVWAMELDVEYSGNALLEAETRLEVSEPEFQRGLLNASMESTSTREASSDLLEGLEHYEEAATLNSADTKVKGDAGDYSDGLTSTKSSSSWASAYTSRWKSMVNLVAGQVSQVPLSLAIRFVSVRGTLRVHIKPPPSEQLWFGFTSMPSIEWNFDSFVGEHKFTGANVLIGNRLKAAIRETLVLPNCEYISLPWMLADRNDWLPRKSAPFLWTNHQDGGGHSANFDSGSSSRESGETNKNQSGETIKNRKDTGLEGSGRNKDGSSSNHRGEGLLKNIESSAQDIGPLLESGQYLEHGYSSQTTRKSDASSHDRATELMEPLLVNPRLELNPSQGSGYSSDGVLSRDRSSDSLVLDDVKPKKIGRKAKMLDLGKKMGEKLEEKRRHLEEKSRIIVERMRENTKIT